MMDMTPKLAEGASQLTAYGSAGFTISGKTYEGAILILPESVRPWPNATLSEDSLASLLQEASLEILLIGTGKTHSFIAPAIRTGLKTRLGCSIETMDTGAACRTFNILLAEGRSVAAALMPL